MEIHYLGQSCFHFVTDAGVRIVTDPYNAGIGYKMPKLPADIVTVSHDHFDHNNLGAIEGNYDLYRQAGEYDTHGVHIRGLDTFHDNVGGRKRGPNVVFSFTADGLTVCHLGDLGHVPDAEQLEAIGRPDILMVPVGEVFTFRVEDAAETVGLIRPTVVIPMHYRTHLLTIGLEKVDKFLRLTDGHQDIPEGVLTVSRQWLDSQKQGVTPKILVMEPQ